MKRIPLNLPKLRIPSSGGVSSSPSTLSSAGTTFEFSEPIDDESSLSSNRTLADVMKDLDVEEMKEKIFQRGLLINKQSEEILLIISENQDTHLLKEKLKNYKVDALERALNYSDNNEHVYPKHNLEVLEDVFLEKLVGKVKTRPVEFAAEKDEGKSSGRFVLKVDDQDNQSLKSKTPWIEKYEDSPYKRNKGEEICEYTAGVLMKLLMGDNSPKARLYKDGDDVKLMFKIIPKFKTLEQTSHKEQELLKVKDAEKFIVAHIIMANYDTNFGNVGLREGEDGKKHLAGIDPEKSFSFKAVAKPRNQKIEDSFDFDKNALSDKEFAINAKKQIFRESIYHNLFAREDSYKKISEAVDKVNIKRLRKALNLALENVEEAYGADVFSNQKVDQELRRRIDFPLGNEITKDLFLNATLSEISKLKNGVKEMANDQLKEQKIEIAIEKVSGKLKAQNLPDLQNKKYQRLK